MRCSEVPQCVIMQRRQALTLPRIHRALGCTTRCTVLRHYHHSSRPPFQRITGLDAGERTALLKDLQNSPLPIDARFRWNDYLSEREKTEAWLRSAFEVRGGKPKLAQPYYFVVGQSSFLEGRYAGHAARVEVCLDGIPSDQVSLTYPDSMASRLLSEERTPGRYDRAVHGRVFLVSELDRLLEVLKSGTEKDFVEAQLWDPAYLPQRPGPEEVAQ